MWPPFLILHTFLYKPSLKSPILCFIVSYSLILVLVFFHCIVAAFYMLFFPYCTYLSVPTLSAYEICLSLIFTCLSSFVCLPVALLLDYITSVCPNICTPLSASSSLFALVSFLYNNAALILSFGFFSPCPTFQSFITFKICSSYWHKHEFL